MSLTILLASSIVAHQFKPVYLTYKVLHADTLSYLAEPLYNRLNVLVVIFSFSQFAYLSH